MMNSKETWRDDPGMTSVVIYRKKYAFFPIQCSDGKKIWLNSYYKMYLDWTDSHSRGEYSHIEFIENISEHEYLVRKLSGKI